MADLVGFRDKSFIEQISILDEIETAKQLGVLPELLELYRAPLGDDGVDQAISDTLRSLLPGDERAVRAGLGGDDARTRRLCAHVAGSHKVTGAARELAELAGREHNPDVLLEVLSALAKLGPQHRTAAFHQHLTHPDPLIAALCLESLGAAGDESALDVFETLVERAEDDNRFQDCDLTTSKAIGALEALGTEAAIRFLVSKIHHRNPNARRLIIEGLTRLGTPVIPYLELVFDGGSVDDTILAANIIGFIGDRSGGDLLVGALDRGKAQHPNVRHALYEALGHIPSLKGLICLLDGLAETNEMLLMAVVTALDGQLNPGILGKVKEHLERGKAEAGRIPPAIVAAKAGNLFQMLYSDATYADDLIAAVAANKDPETRHVFQSLLREMGTDRAETDLARLQDTALTAGHKRLLAADDSKSMLMFYSAVGSHLDYEVQTAANGREALELLQRGDSFDLVVTDLNMPVMDGVELAKEIRGGMFNADVPILMVTTESEGSQVGLARSAGVTDFIQKPLTPESFEAKIRELAG